MFSHMRELYEFRELAFSLGIREIKARYKQTFFGVAWAILQPFALMLISTVVFSLFAQIPSDGVPYPIFSYSTWIFWNFFATTFSAGTISLVSNANLVRRVYFPREICFLAIFFSAALDLLIALSVLVAMMVFYGIPVTWNLLLVVPIFLVQCLFTLGLLSFTSALHVNFRDIGHAIPLVLQIWVLASPVAYPLSVVPQKYLWIYLLNPMAAIIDGYRRVIVMGSPPNYDYLAVSAGVGLVFCLISYRFFKKAELTFADVI